MTSKILCIGDLHLSDRSPTNCTESYNADLFDLLSEIVKISEDRSVDAVVFAGALFHIKQPSRTSHKTVQRMIDVVQSFPCDVYGVIGNHDILQDRIESVFETQPFGVLLQAGMKLLDDWAPGLPLCGISWQQDWQAAGSAFESWRSRVQDFDNALLVTHAPLYPPGRELPYEFIAASTVAEWMGNKGFCFYGHVHSYHGVFEVDGVTFCNYGALSRGSLSEEDLTRMPSVAIWDSEQLKNF